MRFGFGQHRSSQKNLPAWYLAWGTNLTGQNAVWQSEQFAIFQPQSALEAANYFSQSASGRFVVVGDVWLSNRQPLQQVLDQQLLGEQPLSDLQLIAEAWEVWGNDAASKLIGMFGLAVWDCAQQVLTLVRDRTGARTLYYTTEGSTRWIGPSVRSLSPYHRKSLDPIALRDYLCCAFVPGNRTLWQQVKELRPGTLLSFPTERHRSYWQIPTGPNTDDQMTGDQTDLLLAHNARHLRSELNQVVQEYLPKSEAVGVFLSGGLDSSGITALAAKLHNAPVHTYSIHFGKDTPNELEFSSLVAKHCQTQHHILEITFRQMWDKLPETMALLDDPIGDPLTVPNLLLGRLAKGSVSVILNGEGGDPCFGGPKNQPMLLSQLYGAESHFSKNNNKFDPKLLQFYLRSFHKCAEDLSELLAPDVWNAVYQQPSVFSEDLNAQTAYLNRLVTLNIRFKGADHILTKVNNLTQAVGLQGRSPLFDQRIVALSMNIPPEHKLNGAQEKAVLKQAFADLLPDTILNRPKSGMMVPVQLGFYKYWRRQAKGLLLNRNAAIAPYINQSVIRQWLSYEGDTWRRYGVKLWLLASLELWLRENK